MAVRKRGEANGKPNGTANGAIAKDAEVRDAKTDHSRWRMRDDDGRHTWHYLETDEELKAWPTTVADRYFLGQETVSECGLSCSRRRLGPMPQC